MAREQIIVRSENSSKEFFGRSEVVSRIMDLIFMGETGTVEVYNVTTDEIMLEIDLDEFTLSWNDQFAQYGSEDELASDAGDIIFNGCLA